MIILKCRMAGKDVKDIYGFTLACKFCEGIIYFDENTFAKKLKPIAPKCDFVRYRWRPAVPYKPIANFDCPVVLADPRKSDLVEVIE